jgi:trigger factor
MVELGEGRFVPGFVAGIVGMLPGETKKIDVRFPDAYPSAELAGKPAIFTVTVREVKELELPPLDDEFAKTVSQHQSISELRDDVKRRLEAVAAGRSRRNVGNAIVGKLVAAHDFPLPASLVENELTHLLEDLRGAQEGKEDDDELRTAHRAEAESRVKAGLLIAAIAKTENIIATPADVSAELEALARRYGQPAARIRKALGNNVLSLVDGIVRNKTLDFLIDNAIVAVDEETPGTAS